MEKIYKVQSAKNKELFVALKYWGRTYMYGECGSLFDLETAKWLAVAMGGVIINTKTKVKLSLDGYVLKDNVCIGHWWTDADGGCAALWNNCTEGASASNFKELRRKVVERVKVLK